MIPAHGPTAHEKQHHHSGEVAAPATPDERSRVISHRYREGLFVAAIGVSVNIVLCLVQLVLGIVGHSQALLADTLHTLSDLVSDILVLGTMLIAGQPEDHNHPYGHGKIESLCVFVTSLLLVGGGVYLAWGSVSHLLSPTWTAPSAVAAWGALITIVGKELLFRFTYRMATRLDSPSLLASAWHHRSDVLSSLAVLAGVLGAVLVPGLAFLDSLATLIVVGFIFSVAKKIGLGAAHALIDTTPPREVLESILRVALATPGVRGVHNLRARYYGPGLMVDLDIEVNPYLSVVESHEIAEAVRDALRQHENVLNAQIHVDPDDSLL